MICIIVFLIWIALWKESNNSIILQNNNIHYDTMSLEFAQ